MMDNILASYSFLATLNETGNDIYSAVYVPLCKRALSKFAKIGTIGKDVDIQQIISEEYGIVMPIVVVRKLICAVATDLSRKEKERFDFKYFEGGKSFQYKTYAFAELEKSFENERRQSNALQYAFDEFLKSQGNVETAPPLFSEFINSHKKEVSSFLTGRREDFTPNDTSYMLHVKFLQHIESCNVSLYKVVEKIFIGSIIASYIESNIDLSAKFEKGINYYIDSKVVLEALDLQNAEDTQPTRELLQLIKETGGNIKVLDVTLAELHGVIESAINSFNKDCPTTTINEACIRIGKSKTWLLQLNGTLDRHIIEEIGASIDKVSEIDIENYSNSEDLKFLQKLWFRKNAALHDVIAYMYVRDRRRKDSNKVLLQKASCWFVTANRRLANFNHSRKVNGYPSETILPQELTSLLFLQNPKKHSARISNIGLNELIAQVLFDEYPSKDLINEFDEVVKELGSVSSEEYKILLAAVSQQSTSNLQRILEIRISENDKFEAEVHSIIAAEREKQRVANLQKKQSAQKLEDNDAENAALREKNRELENKLTSLEGILEAERLSREAEKQEAELLKLRKWKRRWYIFSVILLLMSIILFMLYFVAVDSKYNYVYQLVQLIDSLDGTPKECARTFLITIHTVIFIFPIYVIFSLRSIKSYDEKKGWLCKFIKQRLNL